MARHLIVTEPFGQYAKGDRITSNVQEILKARRWHVVAIEARDDPEPDDAPEQASPAPDAPSEPPPEFPPVNGDIGPADPEPAPEAAPEHTEA